MAQLVGDRAHDGVELGGIPRMEGPAAGERCQLREQRRLRRADRHGIDHHVGTPRPLERRRRGRVAVAIVAVGKQDHRAAPLRVLNGVDRLDDRVVETGGAPRGQGGNGPELRRPIVRERRHDLDLRADRHHHRLIRGTQFAEEGARAGRGADELRPGAPLRGAHAEAAIDGDGHRQREVRLGKGRQRLGLPVLEDGEILPFEPGDGVSRLVGHRGVDLDQVDARAELGREGPADQQECPQGPGAWLAEARSAKAGRSAKEGLSSVARSAKEGLSSVARSAKEDGRISPSLITER